MMATTLKHTDDDGHEHFLELDRYTGAIYIIRFKTEAGDYVPIPKGWVMENNKCKMKPFADRTLFIINIMEPQKLTTIDGYEILFGAHLSVHSDSHKFEKLDDPEVITERTL